MVYSQMKEKAENADPIGGTLKFIVDKSIVHIDGTGGSNVISEEDKDAEVDMNVVMLSSGKIVEVQGTAEGRTYSRRQLNIMLDIAEQGILSHINSQKKVLGNNLAG